MDPIVSRVAASAINVLVLGETGVGKEVLARRIHDKSPRAKMPLVAIDCGALSESLLESELFGHERGAFTGALQAKTGLLESADGGTVFLDELGEMPLATQSKLLRVIEQREVRRIGAVRPRAIDVRFISATNRDLRAEIAEGRFRQDIYFRLNGISLSIPPLRERKDEIADLASVFIARTCEAMGKGERPRLSADALAALADYDWPGNVRELRNVVERAMLMCTGDVVIPTHLTLERPASRAGARSSPLPEPRNAGFAPAMVAREDDPSKRGLTALSSAVPIDARRHEIVSALARCAGNQSRAAACLGISRATLLRRIDEYAIPRPRKRGGLVTP